MTKLILATNLNCGACVAAVKPRLDGEPAIIRWSVDTTHPRKLLAVEGAAVTADRVADCLAGAGFKVLETIDAGTHPSANGATPVAEGRAASPDEPAARSAPAGTSAPAKPWATAFLATYKPVLLIVAYLLGLTALVEATAGPFDAMRAMNHFMGGFFIAFSFFKLLDLRGFVDSFRTYDVIARPAPAYAWAYPFIELALGAALLARIAPLAVNAATLTLMLVGLAGVTEALASRRGIRCACLGTMFNLPMSKVAFIEDAAMAGMSLAMVVRLAQ